MLVFVLASARVWTLLIGESCDARGQGVLFCSVLSEASVVSEAAATTSPDAIWCSGTVCSAAMESDSGSRACGVRRGFFLLCKGVDASGDASRYCGEACSEAYVFCRLRQSRLTVAGYVRPIRGGRQR